MSVKRDAREIVRMEKAEGQLYLKNSKIPAPGTPYRYAIDEIIDVYARRGKEAMYELNDELGKARLEYDTPESRGFSFSVVAILLLVALIAALSLFIGLTF